MILFSHLDTILVCNRQTHDDIIYCASIASHGKNCSIYCSKINNIAQHNFGTGCFASTGGKLTHSHHSQYLSVINILKCDRIIVKKLHSVDSILVTNNADLLVFFQYSL